MRIRLRMTACPGSERLSHWRASPALPTSVFRCLSWLRELADELVTQTLNPKPSNPTLPLSLSLSNQVLEASDLVAAAKPSNPERETHKGSWGVSGLRDAGSQSWQDPKAYLKEPHRKTSQKALVETPNPANPKPPNTPKRRSLHKPPRSPKP